MAKRELVRRIDLERGQAGALSGGVFIPAGGSAFDDSELVRRDGTHDLYGMAKWAWAMGAEVAGALRSWGSGLVQVFGALYAGRRLGAHAGVFGDYVDDDGRPVATLQATDVTNIPIFTAGSPDDADPDSAFLQIGRTGYPMIYFGSKAGYDRKVPLVDPELFSRPLTTGDFDMTQVGGNLQVPIVDTLGGLAFTEGQLFLLRLGGDSGALYVWTRWGPEPVGGYHRAGPHTHGSFEEGGPLDCAALDGLTYCVTDEMIAWGTGAGQVGAEDMPVEDAGGYLGTGTVEAALEYLATLIAGLS